MQRAHRARRADDTTQSRRAANHPRHDAPRSLDSAPTGNRAPMKSGEVKATAPRAGSSTGGTVQAADTHGKTYPPPCDARARCPMD
jgi:hypothetical protein